MIPYNALKTFQLVIQQRSLRSAAEKLHLTESAVSHQLKKLEETLGETLLYKEGRRLKATPKGLALAQRLQAPFAEIEHHVSAFKNDTRNDIEIFCLPSLISCWLMPKLVTFSRRNPDISVSLNYLQSMPTFIDSHAICIRSIEPTEPASLPTYTLFSGETIPVCSPLYLNQKGSITITDELLQHELLHDKNTLSWEHWLSDHGLHLREKPQHIFEDFHLLKTATLAAQGISLCPAILIEEELANGQLVKLFSQKGNIGRQYVVETNNHPNHSIKKLLNMLIVQNNRNGMR